MFWLTLSSIVLQSLGVFPSEPARTPDWENPAVFERNQVPIHAPLVPYPDFESAVRDDRLSSPFFRLLNGKWRFRWFETPGAAPEGFFRDEYDVSTWDEIAVPGNWQMQGYGHPMFRNVAHVFRSDPPRVPRDYNPTGCYRRTFDLPAEWLGRQVFLHFEGVKSASTVWLNGREVGYHEGGMEPAEYNVTPFLRSGSNTLAARVLRFSDGTYLDDQDMWRLSGIYRDVYLFATPGVHVRDVYVQTNLDDDYRNANLRLELELQNLSGQRQSGFRVLASLVDPSGQSVFENQVVADRLEWNGGETARVSFQREVQDPLHWSSEFPHLYTLVICLEDAGGTPLEYLGEAIGFRQVEIKDRTILVNGVAVKFNGVNRHEHHPDLGKALTPEIMRQDLELMKRFNINLVRTSHYPPDPEFLDLADQYGMYVVDETGDEAHSNPQLSGDPEWRAMYLNRARRMVLRDRNHPSVIFWSAGNESGIGSNLAALIEEGKRLDPGRPWMYGATSTTPDQPFEEIIGPRYPHPDKLERIGQELSEKDSRPSFMDEYLAATGNSLGHLGEYWDLIYRYPRLTGGAIWDWISPGIRQKIVTTPDATAYRNDGALMGRCRLVPGKFGKALMLSGRDEWVELYQDPSLDIAESPITVSLWVYPRAWNGDGSFLTKGDHQFGLIQKDERTLEFFIHDYKRFSCLTPVPRDWQSGWHHLAGVFDGKELKFYVDGELQNSLSHRGRIASSPYPLAIGKNVERHGQNWEGPLCSAVIDEVRVRTRALSEEEVVLEFRGDGPAADSRTVLSLSFETVEEKGEFFSLGIGARAYGLVWPDRRIQPELWQLKTTPQPVQFEWAEAGTGLVRISNRYGFTNLRELACTWTLTADNGGLVEEGSLDLDIAPGQSREVRIPFVPPPPPAAIEHRLLLSCSLSSDTLWALQGHEVAWEQLDLPSQTVAPLVLDSEAGQALSVEEGDDRIRLLGRDFTYAFDKRKGKLSSIVFRGRELLERGPELSVWRAPTSNETDDWRNPPIALQWREAGLDRLEERPLETSVQSLSPQLVRVVTEAEVRAEGAPGSFLSRLQFDTYSSGDLLVEHTVRSLGQFPDWLPSVEMWLPRVGLQMELAEGFKHFTWYGRGPFETYPDRKTGARIGLYRSDIADLYEPYLVPQDYGNRTDVRWAALTDEEGFGLFLQGETPLNVSVQQFSTDNLARARYPFQLKKLDTAILNIDHAVTGVGGTPVPTLEKYRVLPRTYRYRFKLRPFLRGEGSPKGPGR